MLRIFLILLLVPELASAGSIKGSVIDGETLEPLGGVSISAGAQSTTTSGAGRFVLNDLLGAQTVRASAEGYEKNSAKAQVPAIGSTKVTILLYPSDAQGDVVEIVDTAPPLEPVAAGTQELKREELTRIPGTRGDALTSIKSLPGVGSVDGQGTAGGVLIIRGAAPEDSIVQIDGVDIPLLYHFFGLQSVLPSEMIENISFQPGGFGVEYGRATGGIIEITTRNDKSQEWKGFAELSFINLAGLVSGPISRKHNVYITAAARRSAIDFVLPLVLPDDSNISFTTAPTYYDAQLQVDWIPNSRNRISAFGITSFDELKLLNNNVNPNEPDFQGDFTNQTSFLLGTVKWNYENRNMTNRLVLSGKTTGFFVQIGADDKLDINARSMTLRDDFAIRPKKWLNIRFGADITREVFDLDIQFPQPPAEGSGNVANFSASPRVIRQSLVGQGFYSGYVVADLAPLEGLRVSPGVRVEYFSRLNKTEVMPRISFEQKFSDRITVKGAIGRYTRPLSGPETIPTNLVPEVATQLVVGPSVDIAEGITTSFNGFYTMRDKLVTQDPILRETTPDNPYVNSGFGRSYGFEGLIRFRKDKWFGWLSYTNSRSDRVDTPNGRRRLFDFDQTHLLTALASYKLGTWEFGAKFRYSTGVPETPILGSRYLSDLNVYVPVIGAINSARIQAAHQLDVRIDKKFKFKHWELSAFLDITNAYANPSVLGYRYNYDFSEREAITELPILPAIGVRGSF